MKKATPRREKATTASLYLKKESVKKGGFLGRRLHGATAKRSSRGKKKMFLAKGGKSLEKKEKKRTKEKTEDCKKPYTGGNWFGQGFACGEEGEKKGRSIAEKSEQSEGKKSAHRREAYPKEPTHPPPVCLEREKNPCLRIPPRHRKGKRERRFNVAAQDLAGKGLVDMRKGPVEERIESSQKTANAIEDTPFRIRRASFKWPKANSVKKEDGGTSQ